MKKKGATEADCKDLAKTTIEELSGLAKDGQIYQSYETFLPKCLERLQSVTKISDTNYKHRDRVEVLREECMATTHFFKDGLTYGEKEKQCDLFAAHINAAADKEKATGSTKGYEDYCQAYYSYSTAGKPMPDVKKSDKKDKKKSAAISSTTSVVALVASLIAFSQ